jgi:abortive infection bacteriophage resistance protein
MRFQKPPLTPAEQLQLLIKRGLIVRDQGRAERLLEVTSLFRLSPYMRPFQDANGCDHTFRSGVKLAQIIEIYRFDGRLRQLVIAGIERVEVAVRAALSNAMAPTYGAHWYLDTSQFKQNYQHSKFLADLDQILQSERRKFAREKQEINQSNASSELKKKRIERRKRDNYPRFYGQTYTLPEQLPSWAMVEELSFGAISHLYQNLARDKDRKAIARRFGVPQNVLGSWLHTLTFIRNICAHHSRLWNRELAIPPSWPKHLISPNEKIIPRRFFTIAMMLAYLTRQLSPDSRWLEHLLNLLDEFPAMSLNAMGFPPDWRHRLNHSQKNL